MGRAVLIVLLAGAIVGVAFYLGKHRARPVPDAPAPVTQPAAERVPPASVDAGLHKPTVAHPVPANAGAHQELPALDQSDAYVGRVLRELVGRSGVASFLNVDGFARRFVVTVNNLASDSASTERWPVRETAGRFQTDARDDRIIISPRNAARYTPFVSFVEAIDSRKAVAAYVAMYPLLQRAYEELGEPTPYFNDRVVAVIDDLLATPDVGEPVRVKHIDAEGASPAPVAARLYVYDDPSLEKRTAGQKILLRVGQDNAKRLKAKLVEIRALLASQPVRR
ncbi:MAG TPA: DUF3014 domain-containing protein [Polyangia bacterium]|jgi:hypothetical protein|nr:DUF3014 domain-containing protein [Polyangia bacterium]